MSSLRLILVSLLYHWRMNVAVACGVVAGTGVLTGALLVGDSMRGSLRRLTLDRLGRIDEVLLTERFFRAELADELASQPPFKEHFAEAVPAVLLRSSLKRLGESGLPLRAGRVNLLGCDQRFWRLGSGGPQRPPGQREIVLNQALAERLGAREGDRVMLRLPNLGSIPADSPLGRKHETVRTVPMTVSEIVPVEGLGRFSMRPSQQRPRNAFVSLEWLQQRLGQPGRVNAILVAGDASQGDLASSPVGVLQDLLKPVPEDYGIRIEQTARGYFNVTSDRMLLEPAVERAIGQALEGHEVQPALTYLANTLACGGREIPYSTITGVDFTAAAPLGPFLSPEGKPVARPADDQIVLNSWAAEDLGAQPGDVVRVTYFEPESTHGRISERSVELELAAIVELAGAADDRGLTPEVPGVTDKLSMAEWNPPFPFDAKRIRNEDDQYFADHGATPKAFVSLATAQRLWGSRFGRVTSIRIAPGEAITADSLTADLALEPASLGFVFQPVKRQGLAASAGTTPFSVLFLSFSFFIIAAAVMLVALLFRLGIERRAGQLGILVAVGFGRRRIVWLLAGEGLLTAALGSLVGVPVGIGYAALMLLGLRTWWLAAVVTPFLRLHVTASSLTIGLASGVIVAFAAIVWTVWRSRHVAPRQLLAGRMEAASLLSRRRPRHAGKLAAGLLIAALAVGLLSTGMGEEARAGAFFGAGAMVLIGCLTWVWTGLGTGATGAAVTVGRGNLVRMALRNVARNPARSTLTIGLVASACFLIVAVSAFHLDPTQQIPTRDGGNGGFALVAQSDQPVYHSLNTPEGRAELGFSEADSALLSAEGTETVALRVRSGDDASCLNLYQPRQPRMLGVPKQFIDRGGFAWAASAAATPEQSENPWLLLEEELPDDVDGTPMVPVVLDKNTAMYSLHLWTGVGETYDVTDAHGRPIRLNVVGLLAGSIFQGDLLIGEGAFLRLFPELSGYRFFLTETPPAQVGSVREALDRTLGDYGLDAETTGERLARLLAVQNTYLLTFQSLGGLGLLLGTMGLAAVQLRNVLERRGELAVMRAAGFRRTTLAKMVMFESGVLLCGGLLCGLAAAVVAVLPHLLSRGASIPWASLAGTLALVLAVGMVAALAAVRATVTAPLLAALREEH